MNNTEPSIQNADHPRYHGYDIVGDIHGCADRLRRLLVLLGYQKRGGVYHYHDQRRPRQLVFLGDIIDRGPQIRESVLLLREMVEAGSAQVIMGNHEYHALAYTTLVPGSDSDYLRAHNASNNRSIGETLEQFANHRSDWADTLQWFYQWPLVLQFEHFRVAHACWDSALIDKFAKQSPALTIDQQMLIDGADYRTFAAQLLGRTTRGVSLMLPDEQSMLSSDGYRRRSFRVKFWVENPSCYGDIEFQPDKLNASAAASPLTEREREYLPFYGPEQRPLFVGHYWLKGDPAPLLPNIACLDYSAVKDGKLVAYRMDSSAVLSVKQFAWVDNKA